MPPSEKVKNNYTPYVFGSQKTLNKARSCESPQWIVMPAEAGIHKTLQFLPYCAKIKIWHDNLNLK